MEKILFTWSGGKDSAMALYKLQQEKEYEVAALLTTVTKDYGRISMHGVREVLLDRQAAALGLPLTKVYINKKSANEDYEAAMRKTLEQYIAQGITTVAFGDLFLEEVRQYREQNLAPLKMQALFPLWGQNTTKLANRFIDLGFKTIITCVDTEQLDPKFTGRIFDKKFLAALPPNADPCGENGEFHSFVYNGPNMQEPVYFSKGDVVLRDNRFNYCELLPN
ncbi:ATP-binding protein [Candidatus Margulisiibacteriota bacterium]